MRLILLSLLLLSCAFAPAAAQAIDGDLPGAAADAPVAPDAAQAAAPAVPAAAAPDADPYTVTDMHVDVTADTAAHARDQALMQAERQAFTQLCQRSGVAAPQISDDALAALVQSFEVQSEQFAPKRYIGVLTIHFSPAVQRQLGVSVPAAAPGAAQGVAQSAETLPHIVVGVRTDSLAGWTAIKRRLAGVPAIAHIDVIALARGASRVDLRYRGEISDLESALAAQGFVLMQGADGAWELEDGSGK